MKEGQFSNRVRWSEKLNETGIVDVDSQMSFVSIQFTCKMAEAN
jgi:hypothetical protein